MTTLQEAAMRKALELGKRYAKCLMMNQAPFDEALESLRTALAQHEQQPVCAGCGIPEGDVHISTCQSGKWPLRVSNGDTAAPAPQPAQEQVGINALTDAETSASMSVLGLSKPAQGNAELIARSTKVAAELDDFNSSLDRKAAKCIRELLTALQSAQPVSANIQTKIVKDISAHEGGKQQLPPLPTTELDALGCAYCNHPLFLGSKCKNCGKEVK